MGDYSDKSALASEYKGMVITNFFTWSNYNVCGVGANFRKDNPFYIMLESRFTNFKKYNCTPANTWS